ncbi:unnamed protein product [Brassica oleracea]
MVVRLFNLAAPLILSLQTQRFLSVSFLYIKPTSWSSCFLTTLQIKGKRKASSLAEDSIKSALENYKKKKAVADAATETSSSPIRRRSKSVVKLHHQHHKADAFVIGGSIRNHQYGSASSDDTGIEPEQEETALSLMMLSRDLSFEKGHNSVVNHSLSESSDYYSVILETKSSSGEHVKSFNVKKVEEFCKNDKS